MTRLLVVKFALRLGAFFCSLMFAGGVLIVLDSPLVAEGSFLAPFVRWHPFHKGYELMIIVIYSVWGPFMWHAAKNPAEHRLFIDFTCFANLAHFVLMFVLGAVDPHEHQHLFSDTGALGLCSIALLLTKGALSKGVVEVPTANRF